MQNNQAKSENTTGIERFTIFRCVCDTFYGDNSYYMHNTHVLYVQHIL